MRIAIASCSNINEVSSQPVWDEIRGHAPDLLLLLGDQIYYNLLTRDPSSTPEAFEERLRSEYEKQWAEPHFKNLLNSGIPWTAVWDDHDYAWNNAGIDVDPDRKARSTRLFLKYQCGTIRPTRNAIHHSFVLDDVRFIMLDTRSWRESPGPLSSPLGSDQERYLWDELGKPAKLRIVACGSPLTIGRSSLADYPAFTQRLAEFLATHDLRILFLGGDVHDNTWDVADSVIELISSGVARRYAFANKRNYALLTVDLVGEKAVYEMYSKSKPLVAKFDLNTWQQI